MRNKFCHQYLQQEEQEEHQHHQHYHYLRSKFLPMLCSSSLSSPKQVLIKLTHQSHRRHRRCSSTSTTTSSTVLDEPLSPRVGCMGQVKRNIKPTSTLKNDHMVSNYTNKSKHIVTLISSGSDLGRVRETSNSIFKYYKLKSFFSSKNLTYNGSPTTTITTAATTATATTRNGTHKGKVRRPNTIRHDHHRHHLHHHHHHGMKSRSNINVDVSSNNKNNENEVEGCLVNLVEMDPPLPVVKKMQENNNNGENVSLWKRRSGGTPLKSLHVEGVPQSCNNLLVQANTV